MRITEQRIHNARDSRPNRHHQLLLGVLIILFRPFKVGDLVEGGGVLRVLSRTLIPLITHVLTLDNKLAIVPNAKMSGDNIADFWTKDLLRVDLVFGIGYGDNIDKAKEVMERVLREDKQVLSEPVPTVAVIELGDSSVNFACRP